MADFGAVALQDADADGPRAVPVDGPGVHVHRIGDAAVVVTAPSADEASLPNDTSDLWLAMAETVAFKAEGVLMTLKRARYFFFFSRRQLATLLRRPWMRSTAEFREASERALSDISPEKRREAAEPGFG